MCLPVCIHNIKEDRRVDMSWQVEAYIRVQAEQAICGLSKNARDADLATSLIVLPIPFRDDLFRRIESSFVEGK